MHGQARLRKQQILTIAKQLYQLERQTLDGRCAPCTPQHLRWLYSTRPTALGRDYCIFLDYPLGRLPSVYVLTPNLNVLAKDRPIPHIYSTKKDSFYDDAVCLCLYHPKKSDWNNTLLLTKTIIPWVDEWLYYFEDWLDTDTWAGGGEHPGQ